MPPRGRTDPDGTVNWPLGDIIYEQMMRDISMVLLPWRDFMNHQGLTYTFTPESVFDSFRNITNIADIVGNDEAEGEETDG